MKRMEEPIAGSLILADAAADVNDADDASDAGEADCLQIATSAQVEQVLISHLLLLPQPPTFPDWNTTRSV